MKILKAGAECILKSTQISRSEIFENKVSAFSSRPEIDAAKIIIFLTISSW